MVQVMASKEIHDISYAHSQPTVQFFRVLVVLLLSNKNLAMQAYKMRHKILYLIAFFHFQKSFTMEKDVFIKENYKKDNVFLEYLKELGLQIRRSLNASSNRLCTISTRNPISLIFYLHWAQKQQQLKYPVYINTPQCLLYISTALLDLDLHKS